MITAAEIHARLGPSGWRQILEQLGVPQAALRNKHGPCPAQGCGGKDRYRFTNRFGRGDYICSKCGAGDGFKLLERVHGWQFSEARKRVIEAAGFAGEMRPLISAPPVPAESPATPPDRVRRLRSDSCAISNCTDAVDYLTSRGLWPLPDGCTLRAHATAEYWQDGKRVGRYPALLADVRDVAGELITTHLTYLQGGKKLGGYEPRKILSPLTGRAGCAVRLMRAGDALGIAEGIETALAAAALDNLPVWAALNTSLLARFEPPPGVLRLRIFADSDKAGLTAACRLLERLQGRVQLEVRIPRPPHNDFNDELLSRGINGQLARDD